MRLEPWMVLCAFFGVLIGLWVIGFANAEDYQRNRKERAEFVRTHPCPAPYVGYGEKCPGYVVDHIVPLCLGGADRVSNMQWQPIEESYQKDHAERTLCKWVREAREAQQ